MAPTYNSSFFRAVTLKTRVFYFRRVTIHITATVILINMPRRSKRSLKAVAQNSEKGKGFGPVVTIIGTSPTSVVSIHYLDLLIYCNLCVPFEDLSDVVGEDLDEEDNRDTGDDENVDMLPPDEYATKFWNGTIDWGRVDLSFPREGESKRSIQRKRQAEKAREGSMKRRSLIKYLVPLILYFSVQHIAMRS